MYRDIMLSASMQRAMTHTVQENTTQMQGTSTCEWATVMSEPAQSVRVHLRDGGWGESRICVNKDEAKNAHSASQSERVGGRLGMERRLR